MLILQPPVFPHLKCLCLVGEGAVKITVLSLDLRSFGNLGFDANICKRRQFSLFDFEEFGPATNSVKILNPLIKANIQVSQKYTMSVLKRRAFEP